MMSRDLPEVAPGVLDHGAAVAVGHVGGRLEGEGAGGNGALVGGVGVFDVDVEKGRNGISGSAAIAEEEDGVADADFGRAVGVDVSAGAEDSAEESGEVMRVGHDDAWGEGVPAGRLRLRHGADAAPGVLQFGDVRLWGRLGVGSTAAP